MISDILFKMVEGLDRYLNDSRDDTMYRGALRERIIRVRDDAEYIRFVLDTPCPEGHLPEGYVREQIVRDRLAGREQAEREGQSLDDDLKSKKQKCLEWAMSDETASRPPFFKQKDLFERGWSKNLIARLLGDPDWKQENPYYPGTSPMLCWKEDRVVVAEDDPDFEKSRHKTRRQRS